MSPSIVMADRNLPAAADALRRYVGQPWSGGAGEVWAYPYYDALVDHDPDDVLPEDVLTASAVHPKLTQRDLAWFVHHRAQLREFLTATPKIGLAQSDPGSLDVLELISSTGVDLSLLTKVLHRKRPALIPLLDRRLVDWYRLKLTNRGAAAWPELTRALAADLRANHSALCELGEIVPLTHLRIADIAIWMDRIQ